MLLKKRKGWSQIRRGYKRFTRPYKCTVVFTLWTFQKMFRHHFALHVKNCCTNIQSKLRFGQKRPIVRKRCGGPLTTSTISDMKIDNETPQQDYLAPISSMFNTSTETNTPSEELYDPITRDSWVMLRYNATETCINTEPLIQRQCQKQN